MRSLKITAKMLIAVPLLLGRVCCAHIHEQRGLRVQPLDKATNERVQTVQGLGISGQRDGNTLRAQVEKVQYCATLQKQRALGFEIVDRQSNDKTLLMQWSFGAILTVMGGGLVAYSTLHPAVEEQGTYTTKGSIAFPAAIGIGGLALLTASLAQQLSLGKSETPLGERTIEKRSSEFICGREPANGGHVRLTLSDGTQLEADADAKGVAVIELPANIDAILATEGKRATLEAIGDARAQVRIGL